MQINKELLERALVEGVEVEDNPDYSIVSLATKENTRWTGFHTTAEGINPSRWEYVCTLSEYLKAKAEKEKMQEFKVGDLVDVVFDTVPAETTYVGELKYISDQTIVLMWKDSEQCFCAGDCEIRHHRKTQDWFGVEIDAFMSEKPEGGDPYYFFDTANEKIFQDYVWVNDSIDEYLFDIGIWDSEEKAKRSAPLMRQRLIEMAGVK